MKKIFLIILGLLLVSSVIAIEQSVVRSSIKITFDRISLDTGILRIKGEGLDWSKTIFLNQSFANATFWNSDDWNQELELLMIREFGNSTEVSDLMRVCSKNLNFTEKWETCSKANTKLTIQMLNNMINKSFYDECLSNMTDLISQNELKIVNLNNDKDKDIEKWKTESESVTKTRGILTIITIGLGILSLILAIKSGLLKKFETWRDRDKPRDMRM